MRKTPTKFRFGFAGRAHPHVCGENKGVAVLGKGMKGSSPRVRGKLIGCAGVRVDDGLIPACAGKTKSPSTQSVKGRAHPRACGENVAWCGIHARAGSSPRMRGKRRHSEQRRIPRRLIPAHAGKTLACDRGRSTRRAHPRACGENFKDGGSVEPQQGSSPRMRGKLSSLLGRLLRPRLIPAHAGKTFNG